MTSTGLIATASGLAQQHHIVYAQHDARYWLFYIDDDTTKLKTKHSKNLADWTDGAALTLSLGSNREGRNFSVAYANLGETDVVHVVFAEQQGGTRRTYHTRATIASGAVSFSGRPRRSWGSMPASEPRAADPDGPPLVVDGNGFVNVVSGSVETTSTGDAFCDFTIFRSQAPDLGGTWNNGGFGFVRNVGANGLANSHMIVRLDGAELLGGFDYGDFDLTPSNLMWTRTSGGSWGGGQMLFSAGSAPVMSYNDWSFCRTNTEVHVVRRKLDNMNNDLFEHKSLPLGNTQWIAGAGALSADPGAQSSGVVLLRSATKVGRVHNRARCERQRPLRRLLGHELVAVANARRHGRGARLPRRIRLRRFRPPDVDLDEESAGAEEHDRRGSTCRACSERRRVDEPVGWRVVERKPGPHCTRVTCETGSPSAPRSPLRTASASSSTRSAGRALRRPPPDRADNPRDSCATANLRLAPSSLPPLFQPDRKQPHRPSSPTAPLRQPSRPIPLSTTS